MPYSITYSNKILTLAIAPFLFILAGVLCEFAMVPVVYILLSHQEEEYTIFPMGTDVHIQQHIHQEDLNLCLTLHYSAKVIFDLEKKTTRNSTVLWCL